VGVKFKKIVELQTKFKVKIDTSDESNGKVEFTVRGNNKENLEKVEKLLHVHKHEYKLAGQQVAFLIGSKGERIKQILENSGLVKILFEDNPEKKNIDQVC